MNDLKIVIQKIPLPSKGNYPSINDINLDEIIKNYSQEYIIDLERYFMTQLNNELIIAFILKKKT